MEVIKFTIVLLQMVHAISGGPAVDIYADGEMIAQNLEYGQAAKYAQAPVGEHEIVVKETGTDKTLFGPIKCKAEEGNAYTMIGMGLAEGSPKAEIKFLKSKIELPGDGEALVRAVHAAPGAPTVDIYVNDAKYISELEYGKASKYRHAEAGEYSVCVKLANADKVLLDPITVKLKPGKVYSAIAMQGKDGVEVKLITDSPVDMKDLLKPKE